MFRKLVLAGFLLAFIGTAFADAGYDFDNVNDRIDFGNITGFDPSGAWTLHVTAWSHTTVNCSTESSYLFTMHASGNSALAGLRFFCGSTGALQVGVDYATTDLFVTSAASTIATGGWRQMTVTHDGSGTAAGVEIWYEGSEVTYDTQNDSDGALDSHGGSVSIGGRIPSGDRWWDGCIRSVAIWDRVLTDKEKLMLNERVSPMYIGKGLVFYPAWDLASDLLIDRIQGITGSGSGSISVDCQQRYTPIFLGKQMAVPPGGEAAAGVIPIFLQHMRRRHSSLDTERLGLWDMPSAA